MYRTSTVTYVHPSMTVTYHAWEPIWDSMVVMKLKGSMEPN